MRNKDAFRQQFVALQSLGDADAVAHAKDLLSSVDGVSDWLVDLQTPRSSNAGAAVVASVAAAVVAEKIAEKSVEKFAAAPAIEAVAQHSFASDTSADNDLDLDLDDDFAEAPRTAAAGLDTGDDAAFDFELDDDLETPAPARPVSFDLDATSIELPSEPSALSGNDDAVGGPELDLDLEHDDLDLALSEMDDTSYLNDLETLSEGLGDLEAKPAAAKPAAAAFDLDAGDLGADLDLSDEFDLGNVEAELPDIDRLDLAAELEPAAADFDIDSFSTGNTGSADLSVSEDFSIATAATENTASVVETGTFGTAEAAAASDEPADEFDFLADADEIATKLDLARAYIDMGDTDGAKDILDEVMQEGTDTQKQEASTLLSRIG